MVEAGGEEVVDDELAELHGGREWAGAPLDGSGRFGAAARDDEPELGTARFLAQLPVSFHELFAAVARGADDLVLARLVRRCGPAVEAYVSSLVHRSFPQLEVADVDAVVSHVFDRVFIGGDYRGTLGEKSARAWLKRTAWRKACDRARQLDARNRRCAATESRLSRAAEARREEAAAFALAERIVPLLFAELDRADRSSKRRERVKRHLFLVVEHVWAGVSSGRQAEAWGYLETAQRFEHLDARAQRKVRLLVDQHRRRGRERAAELLAALVERGTLRRRDALAFARKHKVPTDGLDPVDVAEGSGAAPPTGSGSSSMAS